MHYILIALEVVLIFNLIIGVHELGHFLAARWRGLKIERFAIWFGKPIWKKKINGVEYALGTIPFGGYVSLPQMATMEAIEGKTDEKVEQLPPVSSLDKIIVAFAGPLFSFMLALSFAAIVWQVGKPTTEADNTTQIGWVDPDGPAGRAGLRAGDTVIEVDGYPVHHFSPTSADSVKWRIVTSTGTNIAIKFLRDGKENLAYVVPTNVPTKWYERKSLRQVFMNYAEKTVVGDLASNSPADAAGLKSGDEIIALDGQTIYSPLAVYAAEDASTNRPEVPVAFTIKRGDQQFDKPILAVKPVQPTNATPSFGITAWQGDTNVTLVHPNPWDQVQASAGQIFSTFSALFARKGDIGVQQLGGAVMILRVYSNLFDDEDGWRRVLWFSVILNVNLALLNLLPLPVLDGGHIMLSLIEAVRRRPVSGRLLERIQTGFAALLITFMIYIAFFDAGDWIRSARADRDVPVVFAPAAK
ncbi:MAG TPA: RIP metalloprotease RseP [Candidatus Sulfotelmatobacter sp.]|nr:RIP metalloprotease RseP [Candidatus Sulfotelmatobacter sp.]